MPELRKLTAEEFNTATVKQNMSRKNCLPVIHVFDGIKTQLSNEFGVLVPRGMYKYIVFVPNALLGEVRWNRVFERNTKKWNQITTNTGVAFLFERQ